MSEEKKTKVLRKPTFLEAFTPLFAMLVILTYGKGVKGFATEPLLLLWP